MVIDGSRSKWRRRRLAIAAIATALSASSWLAWPWAWRESRIWLAERAIARGRLAEAGARLDLLISEEPRRTRPRLMRVQVARQQGQITEAEEILQRTIELGLPVEEGLREFALLCCSSQDFPRAEKSLRRVLEKHPNDREVLRALAEGLARGARWDQASLAYRAWLAQEPGQPDALRGLALANLKRRGVAINDASK